MIKKIDNKAPSIKDLFKDSLQKICESSTSHGLPNMFRTKNWIIRAFWFLLFSGGSGAAIYCRINE